ncbi:phospho-sugar mutase [Listeria costaricensis]|uniref:phospho-sugar mutase n=1 Tax=Listeria costaricensis TaxID=2026604 RepID=UPI000C068F63|nr:phospho-sugar mutase [Listeria costaricensis]
MNIKEEQARWFKQDLPDELRFDLALGADLEDAFYCDLSFGTGGMRGKLGAGPNRINLYTIRRAAFGVAKWLQADDPSAKRSVVIAYDSRIHSRDFAEESAKVLAKAGIRVFLSDELRPTPELSFLVRDLQASAGIMITASHNPALYNGFKVYDATGGQITPAAADQIMGFMAEQRDLFAIQTAERTDPLIQMIGDAADAAYLQALKAVFIRPEMLAAKGANLSICYTPLHGAGRKLVTEGLLQNGFTNVQLVEQQTWPDGNFWTVRSPNPEEPDSFRQAISTTKPGTDLIFATDPDSDRLGVAVPASSKGEFQILTGNQLGTLLLDYLITGKKENGTLQPNEELVTTIVTSDLGRKIATHHGVHHVETLTGFKFIGEEIARLENTLDYHFLFGYEESYGYLAQPFVRDKDAVQAAVLTAEMCLYHKLNGQTLHDRLDALYQAFGYHLEELKTYTFEGQAGAAKIASIMETLRNEPADFFGEEVVDKVDFLTQTTAYPHLPKADVLSFTFTDGTKLFIRPSGTEPKCKCYIQAVGKSRRQAEASLTRTAQQIEPLFH